MEDNNYTLVIDSAQDYADDSNIFHIHSNRMHLTQCLADSYFNKVEIKNTATDILTSKNLFQIFKTLKPGKTCIIELFQPIAVMHEYDSKQIESNAKLSGFTDISTRTVKNNILISLTKPLSRVEEVEVQNTQKTTKTYKK
jgi:hypothetical protein